MWPLNTIQISPQEESLKQKQSIGDSEPTQKRRRRGEANDGSLSLIASHASSCVPEIKHNRQATCEKNPKQER